MGLQLLVEADGASQIEKALGGLAPGCEIFSVGERLFGVSVPSRAIDEVGEESVQRSLARFRRFDLYEGGWLPPKSKWRFW